MTNTQKEAILAYLADLERRHIRLKRGKLFEDSRPACIAGHVARDILRCPPWQWYIQASEILAQAFGINRLEAAGIICANDVGGPLPEDGIRKFLDLCPASEQA